MNTFRDRDLVVKICVKSVMGRAGVLQVIFYYRAVYAHKTLKCLFGNLLSSGFQS